MYTSLGTFTKAKDAATAYDNAAIQAGCFISKLNFPNNVPVGYVPNTNKTRKTNKLMKTNKTNKTNKKNKKNKKIRKKIITIGRKKKALNTTYVGVRKRGLKSFSASITIANERTYLGTFDSAKEAAHAFDHAAVQAGRPKSNLNFPGRGYKKMKKKSQKKKKKMPPPPSKTRTYRGVRKSENGKKFCAQIFIDGTMQGLGTWDTEEEAARAYDSAQKDKSKLNFSSSSLIGDDEVVPVVLGEKREEGEKGEKGEKGEAANVQDEESNRRDDVHSMLLGGEREEEGEEEGEEEETAAAVAIKMKEESVRGEQVRVVEKVVVNKNVINYIGVKKINDQKFEARISMDGNTSTLLGTYDTDREAAIAYDMTAKRIGLPVSKLNFHQVSETKKYIFFVFGNALFDPKLYFFSYFFFFLFFFPFFSVRIVRIFLPTLVPLVCGIT